ncbi:MAG: hypothetical protein AAFY26_24755, partial [Cyanobacteria bacterium J06638_22]
CKNELGWADFRVTDYAVIEKWWEIVMSAYLMVELHTPPMRAEGVVPLELDTSPIVRAMTQHCEWQIECLFAWLRQNDVHFGTPDIKKRDQGLLRQVIKA